jgi:hypothetical protein
VNHRNDTPHHQRPDDDEIPPGLAEHDTPIAIPASAARATIATLNLLHQFFGHHASPAVHAELRAFCALQGWHPACGAQALLDDLGWHTLPLQHALGTTEQGHPRSSHLA